MGKTKKIILVFALFSAVLMAILSLYLSKRMNEDEILVRQLNSSLKKTNERLQNNRQLIRMIIKDVKSRDKIDNEQVYLKYRLFRAQAELSEDSFRFLFQKPTKFF